MNIGDDMNNQSDNLNHRRLAASCFNKTWEYLRKPELTAGEAEEMIHVSHASFWHWNQVEDHTPLNIAIGTWQLASVRVLSGTGARRGARRRSRPGSWKSRRRLLLGNSHPQTPPEAVSRSDVRCLETSGPDIIS